jgi:asparagine synthetase B (glutamine-hydrolysing)
MNEEIVEHLARARRRAAEHHADPIVSALWDNLVHGLSTSLALALSDRAAARHGQECRYPFFDVRVVEFLLAIPHEQRYHRGLPKPVLRRAMVGTLPALVRERRDKADFACYLRRAFLEAHSAALRELFRRSLLEDGGIVSGDTVRGELAAGWEGMSELTVSDLVAMELWLRQATGTTAVAS